MSTNTVPKTIKVKQKMSKKKVLPYVQQLDELDSRKFLDRFRMSISVLCDDNLPPADICHDWFIDPESDFLQGWCIDHTRFDWQQGIGIIDAALVMAEQVNGGNFQTKEEAYPPEIVFEEGPEEEPTETVNTPGVVIPIDAFILDMENLKTSGMNEWSSGLNQGIDNVVALFRWRVAQSLSNEADSILSEVEKHLG